MNTNPVHLSVQFDLLCSPAEYRELADHVAGGFAGVPGLISKLWIIDEEHRRAGGSYLFADRRAANAYLEGPLMARLRANPAFAKVEAHVFDVLAAPSAVTGGLVRQPAAHAATA
jgi:hypothetical protein